VSRVGATAGILAAAFLVAGVLLVARAGPPTPDSVDRIIDEWLQAMKEPSGDRGWSLLGAEAQQRFYGGDVRRYRDDVAGVDWSQVVWAPTAGRVEDGAFYLGNTALLSHPSTLPSFLLERGFVGPMCIDELPYGISVVISVGWFRTPSISGGVGAAGSVDECARTFQQRPGAPHPPFDFVGAAWGSPGPNQRVGVVDRSGLVVAIGAGRENPPLDGAVTVSAFAQRQLAVGWQGTSCDSNTTLIVGGTASGLEIVVDSGSDSDCVRREVTYEAMLDLETEVPVEAVDADLASS
jgi:hypothetical protein